MLFTVDSFSFPHYNIKHKIYFLTLAHQHAVLIWRYQLSKPMVFKTWICWTNCSLGFLISLFPVNQFVSTRKQSSRNCELKQSVLPYPPMCIRLATFTTLQIFPSAYKDCITARGFQTINLRTTVTVSEWEKHECVEIASFQYVPSKT